MKKQLLSTQVKTPFGAGRITAGTVYVEFTEQVVVYNIEDGTRQDLHGLHLPLNLVQIDQQAPRRGLAALIPGADQDRHQDPGMFTVYFTEGGALTFPKPGARVAWEMETNPETWADWETHGVPWEIL